MKKLFLRACALVLGASMLTGCSGQDVVDVYQKIEDTVVGSYQAIEDAVVGEYQKVEDAFVDKYLQP